MKGARILAVLVFAALAGLQAQAQANTITVPTTTAKPVVDGAVASGEYGSPLVVGKTSLSVARSAEAITVALSAETRGWVSIGFGSSRMDKSTIFIGYVKDGKLELRTDLGRGQSHAATAFEGLMASAGRESDGRTLIELALKPAAFIAAGQKELAIIVAYGTADSFVTPHAARWSGSIAWAE